MTLSDHAIRFIENLSLVGDRSGQPCKLLPFQKRILKELFRTGKDGKRVVNRCLIFIPRKNAKTYICACVVVLWLLGLGKKGQQCLSIANDRAQAALLFDCARQIIEADPQLKALVTIIPSIKRISVDSRYSYYQSLSTESSTKLGYSPSLVIIDEAQEIRDPSLIANLTSGFGAREDHLTLIIGTAGTRKDTYFYAEYEYAKKVLGGQIKNPNYSAFIYEAPEDADISDEKVWKRTIPAYGKFCSSKFIKDEYKLSVDLCHKESEFRQFYLNQWQVGGASQWLKPTDWAANNSQPLHDAPSYTAGLDLASVVDTSSLVLFGENSKGLFDVLPFFWVCEAQVEKRRSAEFDYKRWADAGLLRITPGNAQDQEIILADLLDIFKKYKVTKLGIDRYGTNWFGPKLMARGIPAENFGQGYVSMSEPLKQLEKLVLERKLAHGGNPVLSWMCGNAKVVIDKSENYRIVKEDRESKVDGMVALAMAAGVYKFAKQPDPIFSNRDLLFSLLPNWKQPATIDSTSSR